MPIIQVTDLSAPELAVFSRLTEAQLRNRLEPEKGVFIAESPKVIARALDAGLQPVSLLMEPRHIAGDARDIIARCGDIPVYTAPREVLSALTGYALTRGVLCAMRRPLLLPVEQVCAEARRVAVLEGIVDSTNIGAIFRSAAALSVVLVAEQTGTIVKTYAGEHGHRVSGAVDPHWRYRRRLAASGDAAAARHGFPHSGDGTERHGGVDRRSPPCRVG